MTESNMNIFAFPSPDDITSPYKGMSLLDYFAAKEDLSDFNGSGGFCPEGLSESLAGPKPSGDFKTNPIEWFKWDAVIRAKMKYIRAKAMLKVRSEI